jgi:DNA-binding MarR family transcriptional regulator
MADTDARARLADAVGVFVRQVTRPGNFDRMSERAGISVERTGFPILRAVENGPVRVSVLAAELGVDLSTMSRQVRALQDAGLLTRSADPDDGRAAVLALSAEGEEVLDRVRASRRSLIAEQLTGWDEADIELLADLLGRLNLSFQAGAESGPGMAPPPH